MPNWKACKGKIVDDGYAVQRDEVLEAMSKKGGISKRSSLKKNKKKTDNQRRTIWGGGLRNA